MDKSSFIPTQASTFAPQVDLLYYFMLAVTAFFTLQTRSIVRGARS